MSDMRRLLDDPNVSDETRELVGSLEVPAPLSGSTRSAIGARVARSLALPVAATAFLSLKTTAAWAAIVAGGALAVSLVVVATSEPEPFARPSVNATAPVPAPPVNRAVLPAEPEKHAVAEEAPDAKDPAPSPRGASRRDTLKLEESLLEQARRSIDSPARALSLLREHERRFPNGELTAERLYLTAQTQARAGNGTAARHYARLLAERFPKSTYVRRVRPLLDASSDSTPNAGARNR
jgi:hypothetical protein